MATREQVLGNWNQLKGKIKEHWGQLTDNELDAVKGNVDQLIGVIQKKTGEARGQIERFLDQLSDDAGGMFIQATEKARDYMNQGAEAMRGAADQVRVQAREQFEGAHALVRRHPAEAVAVAFGTGLLVGVICGLASRSREVFALEHKRAIFQTVPKRPAFGSRRWSTIAERNDDDGYSIDGK